MKKKIGTIWNEEKESHENRPLIMWLAGEREKKRKCFYQTKGARQHAGKSVGVARGGEEKVVRKQELRRN